MECVGRVILSAANGFLRSREYLLRPWEWEKVPAGRMRDVRPTAILVEKVAQSDEGRPGKTIQCERNKR